MIGRALQSRHNVVQIAWTPIRGGQGWKEVRFEKLDISVRKNTSNFDYRETY